jgi:hypothetical protein
MNRNRILAAILCLLLMTVVRVAAAQEASQQMVSGNWTVSVHAGDKTTTEQWMIKQDGTKITGTVKNERGTLPLTGTIEGAVLRVTVTDGAAMNQVHAYVDGNTADGTVQVGKDVLLLDMVRAK